MALTVTSRGTGTHNTGATTLVPGGRTATLAAGSLGVFCIALDNAGAAGAATAAPTSWTDAKGNVWTRQQSALYDNGAASAGIEMAIYTAPITVALLTTDLGTITWDGAVSPVAKAWTWYEAIPSTGSVSVTGGGTIAGATAANAQVVTASVPVGDAVIAGYFSEGVSAVTGDSDTTNGNWTAQQTATIGSTTSGVRIATQQKVQTTTPSTQTYDATVASQDRIAGYVMLHELVATTVTPGVVSLATATFAPAVTASNNQVVTPGVAALTTSPFAPTVATSNNQLVTPSVASLAMSAFAPTVTASDHKTVTPSTATLGSATFAPTVTASDHKLVTPGVLAVTLTPLAPTVSTTAHVTATPETAALATSAFAPSVATTAHQTVTPDTASLSTAGLEPTVTTTAHVTVEPSAQALALTAFAPDTVLTDHKTVTPDVATLTLTTLTPNVTGGEGLTFVPGVASLSMTAFAPDIALTDNVTVTPSVASLALTGLVPSAELGGNFTVTPGTAVLTLTTFAPDMGDVPLPQALRLGLTFTRPESGMSIQVGHVGLEVES